MSHDLEYWIYLVIKTVLLLFFVLFCFVVVFKKQTNMMY